MAFIANKPIRFDRNYQIGEVIPDSVIDPKMIIRLQNMGRIIKVDLPTGDQTPTGEGSEKAHLDPAQFDNWEMDALLRFAADIGVTFAGDAQREDLIAALAGVAFEPGEIEELDLDQYTQGEQGDDDVTGDEKTDDSERETPDGEANEGVAVITPTDSATEETQTDAPFKCPECGKVCGTKTALTAHQKTHNK